MFTRCTPCEKCSLGVPDTKKRADTGLLAARISKRALHTLSLYFAVFTPRRVWHFSHAPPHMSSPTLPQVQLIMEEYSAVSQSMTRACQRMRELLLLCLDGRTVYGELDFSAQQQSHQQAQLQRLCSTHNSVVSTLGRLHKTFCNDGPEVCVCHCVLVTCISHCGDQTSPKCD